MMSTRCVPVSFLLARQRGVHPIGPVGRAVSFPGGEGWRVTASRPGLGRRG
jgi:hypothetical protein